MGLDRNNDISKGPTIAVPASQLDQCFSALVDTQKMNMIDPHLQIVRLCRGQIHKVT